MSPESEGFVFGGLGMLISDLRQELSHCLVWREVYYDWNIVQRSTEQLRDVILVRKAELTTRHDLIEQSSSVARRICSTVNLKPTKTTRSKEPCGIGPVYANNRAPLGGGRKR